MHINLCASLPLFTPSYYPSLPLSTPLPSRTLSPLLSSPPFTAPYHPPGKPMKTLPAMSLKVTALLELLKTAYRAFTSGQFTECRSSLDTIITSIPLGN